MSAWPRGVFRPRSLVALGIVLLAAIGLGVMLAQPAPNTARLEGPGPTAVIVAKDPVEIAQPDDSAETPAPARETSAASGAAEPAMAVPSEEPTHAPAAPRPFTHTVQPGDSIRSLAEKHGLKIETILAANNLANPDVLSVGQELLILPTDGVLHTVAEGETMRQIAERYGVEISGILAANDLQSGPDLLSVGARLVIPGATPNVRTGEAPALAEGGAQTSSTAAAPQPPATDSSLSAAGVAELRGLEEATAGPRRVGDAPVPDISAAHVAIIDEATGTVLHEERSRERVAPASTTKIATTLVALARGFDPGQVIDVTISGAAMAARDGSSVMGLQPGLQVRLETLLYGMMLPSGNDAAEQVAVSLAGSRERYVGWMNEQVQALGLQDTQFANPSGMDARGHYSTAYDMAMLAREAMSYAAFRAMAGAARYAGDGYDLRNLNRLIGSYAGADGVKIGYTPRAGRTIVASATREGHRVYVSLMNSQDLPGDSAALFNWVWNNFRWGGEG